MITTCLNMFVVSFSLIKTKITRDKREGWYTKIYDIARDLRWKSRKMRLVLVKSKPDNRNNNNNHFYEA